MAKAALVHALYELLCNNCIQIVVRDPTPKSKVQPVMAPARGACGPSDSREDEGMLPYPRRSFAGYRLVAGILLLPAESSSSWI